VSAEKCLPMSARVPPASCTIHITASKPSRLIAGAGREPHPALAPVARP
jgi:hypothetical protein